MSDSFQLIYWPGIPGRGEFIRLAFEQSGAQYTDTCNDTASTDSLMPYISPSHVPQNDNLPPFAPPILIHGSLVISQTANILFYLGPKLNLAPKDDLGRIRVNQLQLTITDFVQEVHDVHHPISVSSYYEDQKEEALRRSQDLRDSRIPKFLRYFERCIADTSGWLLPGTASDTGDTHGLTYADLSLFQVIEGLEFAFPKFMAKVKEEFPKVMALHQTVKGLPTLRKYLKDRIPFGDGVFRHYPELDDS